MTILGLVGNDLIFGTIGDDIIDASQGGSDRIIARAGDDQILMGAQLTAFDRINGGDGADTVALNGNYGAGLIFRATTLVNVETLLLDAGFNYRLTTNDANVASGQRLTIDASALGSTNKLTFDGSAETDGSFYVTGGAGKDVITTGAGADEIHAGAGNDTINGGGGDDILDGGAGNDSLIGGAGADTFVGGAGNDALNGGDGANVVDYSAATGKITVNLNLASAQAIGGGQGTDTLTSIYGVNASDYSDTIIAHDGLGIIHAGGGADNVTGGWIVYGEAGNDTLQTPAGSTSFIMMVGGAGNDTIIGTGNSNAYAAYVDATSGVTVNLGISGVQNTIAAGRDTLIDIHNLTGSTHDDHLTGSASDDAICGWTGDDVINGGGGFDVWIDLVASGSLTVDLAITGTQDTGADGIDTITNIEAITSGNYDDTLSGNANANTLNGGGGDDVLNGRGGNDTLIGGAGMDDLTGGTGKDTFVFADAAHSTVGAPDWIHDFGVGADKIDLSAIDADTGTSGDQAFHLGGGGGHAGDIVVTYDAGSNITMINLYANTGATVDMSILLDGDHSGLTAGVFVL